MSAGRGQAPARRIVGNLDCESDFAALAGHPAGPLPRRVLRTIAGAATLLRAFARDTDRLWLPAPVAPASIADVPGLPRPALETGGLDRLEPAGEVLAWGQTPTVAGGRRQKAGARGSPKTELHGSELGASPTPPSPSSRRLRSPECAERVEKLRPPATARRHLEGWHLPWRLPAPAPAAAAAVNDRRFALALAAELGCRLPGAGAVASPAELAVRLETAGLERWVLKAPFSAAGRRRLIHLGGAVDARVRRRIEHLFARHGELVLEPWMARTADLGVAAALTPEGLLPVSLHRLLVDSAGRFRGLELIAGDGGLDGPWLRARERERLEQVLEGVARALRRAGFSGAFGVDAWRYAEAGGAEAFHPLGEINGRLTFGWVARALIDRVRGPLGIDPGSRVRLIFGRAGNPAGARIVPLLGASAATPGPLGGSRIRLEIFDPP